MMAEAMGHQECATARRLPTMAQAVVVRKVLAAFLVDTHMS
jgi:hypothetical protein